MAASTQRPRAKRSSKIITALSNLNYSTLRKDLKIILINPEYSWIIGLLLLVLEIIVTSAVIIKIPCKLNESRHILHVYLTYSSYKFFLLSAVCILYSSEML